MRHSDTQGEIGPALVSALAHLANPPRTAVNPFFKSKYAPLHATLDLVRAALAEHSLGVIQGAASLNGQIGVTTRIVHTSGEWIESDALLLHPAKDDPQGGGSAVTYARRYSLEAMLGICGEVDDDGNAASKPKAVSKPAAAPKPASAPASTPKPASAPAPPGGDALRDAKLGFGKHKDKSWRAVEYDYLVWVRDNIDPAKDGYAKAKHGGAVAELAARAADGHSELPAFPAGFGPDLPLPTGYEHAGEKLGEVPAAYLERMNEKGKGKCVKVAIAELARRAKLGISISEPEPDDGGDLPERTTETVCQHCGSDDMTADLCSKGFMKCTACGKHTAVKDDGGDLPDGMIPF